MVATSHEWSTAGGVAHGRIEKAVAAAAVAVLTRALSRRRPAEQLTTLREPARGSRPSPSSRSSRAAAATAATATQANEPPTEIRATPASASCGTVGPPGRTITFTGRSTARTSDAMSPRSISPGA